MKKVVSKEYPDVGFETFLTDKNPFHNQDIIDSVRSLDPRLVLTVGSPATGLARENFDDLPIVFSAVKYPALSGSSPISKR
jgi:ABC-type uncharacterized transport system substrate-binding protein